MKKVLLSLIVILCGLISYGADGCPTPEQYQAKAQEYQMLALKNMSANADIETSMALTKEMETYFGGVCVSCIEYFKTTKTPDCSKLNTMAASFVLLDESEKAKAKAEIYKLLPKYENSCSTYVEFVKLFVK